MPATSPSNLPTCRIVLIAKAPLAGYCKTRLIPALGPDGAAALAAQMLRHVAQTAVDAQVGPVEICGTPCACLRSWRGLSKVKVIWASAWRALPGARWRAARRCC